MTELFETTDPADHRLLQDHAGPFATLNDAGLVTAGDVRTAQVVCRLGGEASDEVLLATALLVRAARHGSVCVDLAEVRAVAPELPWPDPEEWVRRLTQSPLVAVGEEAEPDAACPLRLIGTTLYLDRYWREEVQVCEDLLTRIARPVDAVDQDLLRAGLDRLFPETGWEEQTAATAIAMSSSAIPAASGRRRAGPRPRSRRRTRARRAPAGRPRRSTASPGSSG